MSTESKSDVSPCLSCGACCAFFRVSFYWAEAEALAPALIEQVNPLMACMAGTNRVKPRCNALVGEVGVAVSCSVYGARPSPCHELQAGDERCNRARAAHGLGALVLP